MTRHAVVLMLAVTAVQLSAQDAPRNPKVAEVTWRDVYDFQGNRSSIPVFSRSQSDQAPATGRWTFNAQAAVLRVDEQFRLAKLANDVRAIRDLLSDDFVETNQNGNSRDKSESLDLWATYKISSLVTERATIRLAGDYVTMTGQQTEVNGGGTDRMLFTRVYVRSAAGDWKLLSSTQFRNPQ
jgi:Domain of unknown function (DUF4440)